MGSPMEIIILILIVVGLCYFISYKATRSGNSASLTDKFNISPYFGTGTEYSGIIKCEDDLGSYYMNKYTDRQRYHPLSTDAMDYAALKQHQAALTHQDMWRKQMAQSLEPTYRDDKGNMYKSVAEAQTKPSNVKLAPAPKPMPKAVPKAVPVPSKEPAKAPVKAPAPKKEGFVYNRQDRGNNGLVHEYMADNKNSEDRNAPLSVQDLLPDPCLNNGKDWTNVFTECENLVGGQNFVRFEDEHFTNQVLDTRCTKYQSHDLRRTPAIQYADVSIWNKPSVCKNIFEYIRPHLDGDC